MADSHEIAAVIGAGRYSWQTEADLQSEIAADLARHGFDARREVALTDGDRIDILSGRVGIEVKIKGSASSVARQLQRYAHSPDVDTLILATTRPHHRPGMPPAIGGKPLVVAVLAGSAW